MKIPEIILAMFDRANEIYNELIDEYKECIKRDKISNRAIIMTHEVLEKCRHALDHSIRIYWNKKFKREISHTNVFFPITSSLEFFLQKLKKQKMKNLKENDPKMYKFLLNIQIFNNNEFQWLYDLNTIVGRGKHEEFSKQARKNFEMHTLESYGGIISWAVDLNYSEEPKEGEIAPLNYVYMKLIERSDYDPNISHKIEKSVSFRIGNDNQEVTAFLEEAIRKIYKIVQEFYLLF